MSVPIGCSDHNIVVIARRSKVPKAKPRVVYRRSYRCFSQDLFLEDVSKICWSNIYKEKEPDAALNSFLRKFQPVIDKHAPIRKLTVMHVSVKSLEVSQGPIPYNSVWVE